MTIRNKSKQQNTKNIKSHVLKYGILITDKHSDSNSHVTKPINQIDVQVFQLLSKGSSAPMPQCHCWRSRETEFK